MQVLGLFMLEFAPPGNSVQLCVGVSVFSCSSKPDTVFSENCWRKHRCQSNIWSQIWLVWTQRNNFQRALFSCGFTNSLVFLLLSAAWLFSRECLQVFIFISDLWHRTLPRLTVSQRTKYLNVEMLNAKEQRGPWSPAESRSVHGRSASHKNVIKKIQMKLSNTLKLLQFGREEVMKPFSRESDEKLIRLICF